MSRQNEPIVTRISTAEYAEAANKAAAAVAQWDANLFWVIDVEYWDGNHAYAKTTKLYALSIPGEFSRPNKAIRSITII